MPRRPVMTLPATVTIPEDKRPIWFSPFLTRTRRYAPSPSPRNLLTPRSSLIPDWLPAVQAGLASSPSHRLCTSMVRHHHGHCHRRPAGKLDQHFHAQRHHHQLSARVHDFGNQPHHPRGMPAYKPHLCDLRCGDGGLRFDRHGDFDEHHFGARTATSWISGTNASRTLNLTTATNLYARNLISIVVTDGGSASATNNFLLTVLSVNDAPTFSISTNRIDQNEDAGLTTVSNISPASPAVRPTNQPEQLAGVGSRPTSSRRGGGGWQQR